MFEEINFSRWQLNWVIIEGIVGVVVIIGI